MRNRKKIIIYPCYFDARRSRRMGRRVPKDKAVVKPMLEELRVIADHLKLDYELEPGASHPAAWWDENKGRILVKKVDKEGNEVRKAPLVKKMSRYLIAIKKKKKEQQLAKEKHDRRARVAHSRKRRRG